MQDIDIISVDFLNSALEQYAQIVQNYGRDSAEAKDFQAQQVQLLDEYSNGNIDLEPSAVRLFVDYVQTFGAIVDKNDNVFLNTAGQKALARLQEAIQSDAKNVGIDDAQDIQAEIEKIRVRSPYSDQNQFVFDRVAADVYLDMGIITQEEHDKSSQIETIEVIGKIPDLQGKEAIEFSERFIDKIVNNDELFRMAPPTTLANAYQGTKERLANGDGDKDVLNARLQQLSDRIDELIDNFATNSGYYFADPTNIADAYDGYNRMFDVRRADMDAQNDAQKIRQIEENKQKLEEFITEYDRRWGLDQVTPEDAKELSKRWDELLKRTGNVQISDETLYLASKYKFVDADGNVIPQLIDDKGNKVVDHARGAKLDPNGRLARVIDLARHDVAMSNLGNVKEEIDDKELESEVNERIPYKLFEIDTADKIVRGAQENPEQFTDPQYLQKFIEDLSKGQGEISDAGYQAAMDAQVNQTGGFCGRLKSKLKNGASKVGGLFGKIFKPLRDIDKRKDARVVSGNADAKSKRSKRIEMFVRILKGFGSAFLVSAAITTIATAAAATAGISLAASLATIGVVTGIAMGYVQISKWRSRQLAEGKPADIKAFLKDKRMMATMGTTALASVAMIFGAAGLQQVAMALGYGALALGGSSNAIAMYKDAKNSGLSAKESAAWAIANALAVLGGGIAGRMTANAAINAYNQNNPENTLFQNKEVQHSTQNVEHTETRTEYTDDALRNAERISKMWYADNPTELQHRVDMINAYNAEHGTNIDPYRAIMLNADAGGHTFDNMALHVDGGGVIHSGGKHTVLTDFWGSEHGVSHDELNALKNMFSGDQINPDAMNAAIKIDPIVSANNEVGVVSMGNMPHYDGVLHQNTVDANGTSVFNTYADGGNVFQTTTQTIVDTVPIDVTTYTPVDVPWGLGMFGISYPRTSKQFEELKDRLGSLMDRIEDKRGAVPPREGEQERGLLPPHEEEPGRKALPPHSGQKQLPPHEEEPGRKALPPHSGQKQLPPHEEEPGRKALPPHSGQKQLPPHEEEPGRKALPPHSGQKQLPPHEEEKHRVLNITRAQAKKLDELEERIAAVKEQRVSGLKQSDADKLHSEQKRLEQELSTLLNKLGRPSEEVLNEAKADAYRRYELQNAIHRLDKMREQLEFYESHKSNRPKAEGRHIIALIEKVERHIDELGGAESLNDTSYLYEPVPFKPDRIKQFKNAIESVQQEKKKQPNQRTVVFYDKENE